ncbi:hypothetical protein M422DRAFT_224976 [Sphaerobolus stellatus SS14]|nr:hypothetical protein M422DRAFT_224976 [Sphaerobolus stellatus SS14]
MISNIFKISAVLLAGVGTSTAASFSRRSINLNPFGSTGLSSDCQNALFAVAGNPAASSCLNVPGLIGIVTIEKNASAIEPLNTWLQGVCAADACSNATINAIAANITSGCQSDLNKTGVSQNVVKTIVQDLPQFYPTVRKIACLKTASNNTLCASSTLVDVQQSVGQNLSVDNALSTFQAIFTDVKTSNLPPSVVCTGCIQGAFDILQQDVPSLTSNSVVQSGLASTCGNNFLSGTATSDVTEGTGSAAPSGTLGASKQTNGAMISVPFGAMFSLLSTIAGAFVIFA